MSGIYADSVFQEELDFDRIGHETDVFCDRIDTLCRLADKLEDESIDTAAKAIYVERLKGIIGEQAVLDLFLDTENAKDKTSLIGKILGLIRKAIGALFSSLANYLTKVFSFVNLTLKKANKLATQINRSLYRYDDTVPEIRNSGAVGAIVDNGKLPDAKRVNEILNRDLRTFSSEHLITALMPSVASLVAESYSGKSLAEIKESLNARYKLIEDTAKSKYKASKVVKKETNFLTYGIKGLPNKIEISWKAGQPPQASIAKAKVRRGTMMKGYGPAEAQSVITGVVSMLSFILDKDNGSKFKKEIDKMNSSLKAANDGAKPVREIAKIVPQWVKFIRNHIKTTIDYEYRICRAAYIAVAASKEKWTMSK
ncbi:hypothetical protein SM033_00244 [Vibrio phage vB_VpaM_sm033]|nr:hypothetical protein SM033_00244 [Vibrio phage vB_VpaM_sm033]